MINNLGKENFKAIKNKNIFEKLKRYMKCGIAQQDNSYKTLKEVSQTRVPVSWFIRGISNSRPASSFIRLPWITH